MGAEMEERGRPDSAKARVASVAAVVVEEAWTRVVDSAAGDSVAGHADAAARWAQALVSGTLVSGGVATVGAVEVMVVASVVVAVARRWGKNWVIRVDSVHLDCMGWRAWQGLGRGHWQSAWLVLRA